jgi:hypothetical protein
MMRTEQVHAAAAKRLYEVGWHLDKHVIVD